MLPFYGFLEDCLVRVQRSMAVDGHPELGVLHRKEDGAVIRACRLSSLEHDAYILEERIDAFHLDLEICLGRAVRIDSRFPFESFISAEDRALRDEIRDDLRPLLRREWAVFIFLTASPDRHQGCSQHPQDVILPDIEQSPYSVIQRSASGRGLALDEAHADLRRMLGDEGGSGFHAHDRFLRSVVVDKEDLLLIKALDQMIPELFCARSIPAERLLEDELAPALFPDDPRIEQAVYGDSVETRRQGHVYEGLRRELLCQRRISRLVFELGLHILP